MNTRVNPVGFSPVQNRQNLSFKSNSRFYRLPNGEGMETFTYFFREDLPWKEFIPFIKEHFKSLPKVRILNAACSDGTEAYSLVIALKELLKGDNYEKFLPIQAYDIDEEILRAANSGLILINPDEIYEIKRFTNKVEKYLTKEDNEVLKIYHNGFNTNKKNNLLFQTTYKVNKRLKKEVNFNQADIYNILENYEDNGNTILFFRNTLGHFNNDKRKEFIKLFSTKLKAGSLLTIGSFDTYGKTGVDTDLEDAGFTKIMRNVYRKDTQFEIFIKKIKTVKNNVINTIKNKLFLTKKNDIPSKSDTFIKTDIKKDNDDLSLIDKIKTSKCNFTYYAYKTPPESTNKES